MGLIPQAGALPPYLLIFMSDDGTLQIDNGLRLYSSHIYPSTFIVFPRREACSSNSGTGIGRAAYRCALSQFLNRFMVFEGLWLSTIRCHTLADTQATGRMQFIRKAPADHRWSSHLENKIFDSLHQDLKVCCLISTTMPTSEKTAMTDGSFDFKRGVFRSLFMTLAF